MNFYLNGL